MKFAIRDDDICYFTRPAQLEASYADIWDICPVSLSVVPFHGCAKSGALPRKYWKGDEYFPIGENAALVKFLKTKISEKKVCVTLHGYSHQDRFDGYEFESGVGLSEKVRVGKEYLEQLFEVPIQVFVPPHNTISAAGLSAVIENRLAICSRTWPNKHGGTIGDWFRYGGIKVWEKARQGAYPGKIIYSGHSEVGYFSLTPIVSLAGFTEKLDFQAARGGVFVLATHSWEFDQPMRLDLGLSMRGSFRKIWNRVQALGQVDFLSLNDLLGETLCIKD